MAPTLPARDEVREMLDFAPERGVLSVCLRIDPGDRAQAWRVELRDRLRALEAEAPQGDRAALAEAAKRVLERFPDGGQPPPGRGHFGFVELGGDREVWYATQLPPPETSVVHRGTPSLSPLVTAAEAGRPRLIALVSAERVRLARWHGGALAEVQSEELETFELDWRDSKAPRPPDPAQGQGVSASGRDRYDARLEDNRKQFLQRIGELVGREAATLDVEEILAIGPPEHASAFVDGVSGPIRAEAVDEHDLISERIGELGDRVSRLIVERDAQRQQELVDEAIEKGSADLRATVGPRSVADALVEGRVAHLLVDCEGEVDEPGADGSGSVDAEWLVERALETGATITPVAGRPAEALGGVGGVAALLRY